ncbi:30S ribosomal protein S2 [Paludisphaera sp.]|uniref:30S ribosomal protein S2 n=1 Tax=Paludisphaera sp. TaxID=2017432 RepID=UPI00301D8F83
MALVVKDLIDAGVHFGHRASRWNPKMKPYIYGKRNLIHIIDLKETVRGLLRATKYFHRVASQNGLILFVGTKRQASETIAEECARSGMPYVTERWLGGTLTNFRTIRSRLERLEELEQTLDGEMAASYSKKMISTLTRERKKIERNLSGIRNMTRLPEALLVIDPRREHIAVAEARKLGIKVVALLDTDCDPDSVDLPIPGNDDSMRSIELVIKRLTDSIIDGKAIAPDEPPPVERDDRIPGRPDRRGPGGRDRRGPGGPRDGLRMGGNRPQPGPAPAAAPAPPAANPTPAAAAEAASVATVDTPPAAAAEVSPIAENAPAQPIITSPEEAGVAPDAPASQAPTVEAPDAPAAEAPASDSENA